MVISKSYVVYTTFISIVLFGSSITWEKLVAIGLIVGFSALIIIDRKSIRKSFKASWLPLAIGAFFCWGSLTLVARYLSNQGVNVYVYLTYMHIIVTSCILVESYRHKIQWSLAIKHVWILIAIGIGSALFNTFMFLAIAKAPNVGYVNAINASSISAVTVLSILFFKDEFSIRKLIGVFGVIGGLLLLLI